MENILEQVKQTSDFLKDKGFYGAKAGVVLGTGLGAFAGLIDVEHSIAYQDIPGFPPATVEFHKGLLISGKIGNTKVVVMQEGCIITKATVCNRSHFPSGFCISWA